MADYPVEPFRAESAPQDGLWKRLRGRISRETAFILIRNILATTPYDQVSSTEIAAILDKAKVKPEDVAEQLAAIYEHAVLILAADHEISAADRQSLGDLQRVFNLTDTAVAAAHERAVGSVFEWICQKAMASGSFSQQDHERLSATASALGMSDSQSASIYSKSASAAVQLALDAAVADRRFSAEEEIDFRHFAKSLGVVPKFEADTQAVLDRFRLLAKIDAGDLPIIAPPIVLQRGEICHFWATHLTHKELRSVTRRVNYSGPTVSIPIVKGIRWRAGSLAVHRVSEDVLTQIDTGGCVITNKKVFFQGARKNTSVALTKIVQFTVFTDGLQIEKESGKDLYVIGKADWELAGAVLDAVLQKSRT